MDWIKVTVFISITRIGFLIQLIWFYLNKVFMKRNEYLFFDFINDYKSFYLDNTYFEVNIIIKQVGNYTKVIKLE